MSREPVSPPEKIAEAEKWMSITWAGIIAGFVVGFGIATIHDVRPAAADRLPQSAIGTRRRSP